MRGIGALHSSDEIKTVQTAEIVGETIGLPVNAVHDLREHERHGTPIVDAEDWRSTVIESIRNQNEHIYGSEAVGTARMRFGAAVERLMETSGARPDSRSHRSRYGDIYFRGRIAGYRPGPDLGIPWFTGVDRDRMASAFQDFDAVKFRVALPTLGTGCCPESNDFGRNPEMRYPPHFKYSDLDVEMPPADIKGPSARACRA